MRLMICDVVEFVYLKLLCWVSWLLVICCFSCSFFRKMVMSCFVDLWCAGLIYVVAIYIY